MLKCHLSPHDMASAQVLPRNDALFRQLSDSHSKDEKETHAIHAQREVDLLNHCFDDIERFMGRLQQAADIQRSRQQSKKEKSKKKNSKKNKQEYAITTEQASIPTEEEFVDIFQKMKYSLCLLDRLKIKTIEPPSVELLHHLFVPLHLMVKTTRGPNLAAGVSSPALTSGAISFLEHNLTPNEKELWCSLGPNWTQSYSLQALSMSPYNPVFLDGWKPEACDESGQAFVDPIESQKKYETLLERQQSRSSQSLPPIEDTEESVADPLHGQLYQCSYDFVARNSSELSVLHGEVLQVLDSSKRWWKCRNDYEQIGFVPSTILEPFNHTEVDSSMVMHKPSMKAPLSPLRAGRFSYVPSSPSGENHTHTELRPLSMPALGGDEERVLRMNNELAQRLAKGKAVSLRPSLNYKPGDDISPLNYDSSPAEVQDWLKAKSFSHNTVSSLGILTGAQLFSLSKEELCLVSSQDGARVYSQIMMQKVQLERERKSTELESVMKKQKMKVDTNLDGEV